MEEVSIEKEAVVTKTNKKKVVGRNKSQKINRKRGPHGLGLATPIVDAAWERKTCRPSRDYIMI